MISDVDVILKGEGKLSPSQEGLVGVSGSQPAAVGLVGKQPLVVDGQEIVQRVGIEAGPHFGLRWTSGLELEIDHRPSGENQTNFYIWRVSYNRTTTSASLDHFEKFHRIFILQNALSY